MTPEKFRIMLAKMHNQEVETCQTKGREYSGDDDSLDNFKRLSFELDETPEKILWVYLKKHLDAIVSYIREGKTYSTETIQSRIMDSRLYLALLQGLIVDRAETQELLQKEGGV